MANDRKLQAMGFPSFSELWTNNNAEAVLDTNHNRKLDPNDERVSLVGTDLGDQLMGKKLMDRTQTPGMLTPQLDLTPTTAQSPADSTGIPGALKGNVDKADQRQTAFIPTESYPKPVMVDAQNRPIDGNAYASRPMEANAQTNNWRLDARTGAINLDNFMQHPSGDVLSGHTGARTIRWGMGQSEENVDTQIVMPANIPLNREITALLLNGRTGQYSDGLRGRVVLENGTRYFVGTTSRNEADGTAFDQVKVQLTHSHI